MSSDDLIRSLQVAVDAAPADMPLRVHLIRQLIAAGRAHEAVAYVRAGHDHDPADPEFVRASVELLEAMGDRLGEPMRERLERDEPLGDARHDDAHHDDARRRAVAPDGTTSGDVDDEPASDIPDTIDELLEEWETTTAVEEVDIGELGAAGVTLADVGGLDAVKAQLDRSFLAPIRNPEVATVFGKAASGGLLLWGPPGCGKTFLARATAGEMSANFYNVGLADVLDMWIGASERNLAYIFDVARENAPCVLFFDEIDALGQKRSNLRVSGAALRGVVNQLLSELDGAASNNDGVFVLSATNHPWDVDEALLRPGRFDRRLLVLPPDAPARRSILSFHLRGKPAEGLDLDDVVQVTEGYSGADLALVVEEATEAAMTASLESGRIEPISNDVLRQALSTVQPSIGPWLETARNHVVYANRSGEYDELEAYLRSYDAR